MRAVLLALCAGLLAGLVLWHRPGGAEESKRWDADVSGAGPARDAADREVPPGQWYMARRLRDPELTADQIAQAEALEALGYAPGVEVANFEVGVTTIHRELAQPGLNLFVSGHGPVAILMDLEGEVLHEWRCDARAAFPGREPGVRYFRRARVLENGDLYAIISGVGMVKLDWDSNLLWSYEASLHHDLDLYPDGRILVLDREAYMVPWMDRERPTLDNFITVLDPEGKLVERISLLECIKNSRMRNKIATMMLESYSKSRREETLFRTRMRVEIEAAPDDVADKLNMTSDVFHTNTIQYLDGSNADRVPAFREGNILLSVRNLDLLVVVDPRSKRIEWMLKGEWSRQHEPVVLESGNLLLFDNAGPARLGQVGFSQVLEIDPVTEEVVWFFRASEPSQFLSVIGGTCQRLANGNTLMTESTAGRAFELTPKNELVWEFFSPYRAGDDQELVAFLPDLVRLPPDFLADWMTDRASSATSSR